MEIQVKKRSKRLKSILEQVREFFGFVPLRRFEEGKEEEEGGVVIGAA